jgi:ubiquinone/menaquinone biosynthesis C-methylase UbiE
MASMHNPQTNYPNDLADMTGWITSHVFPGARVLEVGCGDGAFVHALAPSIDIVGVDPNVESSARTHAARFEDFDAEPFDVLFSSVALHHLHDAEEAGAALKRLSKPGSVMLVREFDKDLLVDEPTQRWWFHQRHAKDAVDSDGKHPLPNSFEEYMAMWREQMDHHVHAWPVVESMLLSAGFQRESVEPMPYLFRWSLSEDVRPIEERLIASGLIKQVGLRWQGRRSS